MDVEASQDYATKRLPCSANTYWNGSSCVLQPGERRNWHRRQTNEVEVSMSPLHNALLDVIKANDGKYSWYQLDRALSCRGLAGDVSSKLMAALHELEQGGFITTTAGHSPAQPLYLITDEGKRVLESSS